MKLLLVTDDDGRGGSAVVTRQLAQELSSLHAVTVAYRFDDVSRRFFAAGHSFCRHLDSGLNQASFRKSVHDHRSACGLLGEAGCEFIIFSDSMVFSSSLAMKEVAHQSGIPYISIVNGMPAGKLPWLRGEVEEKSLAALSRAHATVFVSAANLAMFRQSYPSADVRAALIPNCCGRRFFEDGLDDAGRQALRSRLGIGRQSLMMFSAARVTRPKGHHLVLSAMSALRSGEEPSSCDLHYVVAGPADGQYLEALRKLARQNGIEDQVRFLGHRQDIAELMQASDVCVLASYSEGMPLAVAEAMACGKPVIGTRVGGIPEQVLPAFSWLLPDPNDSASACASQLVQVLSTLCAQPGVLAAMGARARQHALAHFHPDLWRNRYAQLIGSAAPGKADAAKLKSQQQRYALGRGSEVRCSDPGRAWCYLMDGWSNNLAAGVFQRAREAGLNLPFEATLDNFTLRLKFLNPDPGQAATLTIILDGEPVTQAVLDRKGLYSLDLAIDSKTVNNPLALTIVTDLSGGMAVEPPGKGEAPRGLILESISVL